MLHIKPKHDQILEVTPFHKGGSEMHASSNHSILLASNENALGPSQLAIQAIQEKIYDCHRYPSTSEYYLKSTIAQKFNVEISNVAISNGSDALFSLLTQTFLTSNDEVILSQYAFSAFAIAVQVAGARIITTPAKQWGHDLSAMANAVTAQTKMIFIANPNNPTGTWINEADLISFLHHLPSTVMVILDEAYAEYVVEPTYPNSTSLLKQFPNLIVLRTFSKLHGLAGLRLGYSLSNAYFVEILNKVALPYSVNIMALAAGEAALKDSDHIAKSVAHNQMEKQRIIQKLHQLGLEYIPSVTNFITVHFGDHTQSVFEYLKKENILVMPLKSYKMFHHLRITIGSSNENKIFLDKLDAFYCHCF